MPPDFFPDGVTPCHDYEVDTVERPMVQNPLSSVNADYYPDLDIVIAYIGEDATWVYMAMDFVGFSRNGDDFVEPYGFEIEYSGNSRSDVFIKIGDASKTEAANTWTTKDLEIWQDDPGDSGSDRIGSTNATMADGPTNGDGYDVEAWKDGNDPTDTAYWRKTTSGTARIEFAIKKSFLTGLKGSAFSMTGSFYRGWTMKGINGPSSFLFHDEYTAASYGSPYQIAIGEPTPGDCADRESYDQDEDCDTNDLFPVGNVYEQDNTGGIGSTFSSGPTVTLRKA